MYYSLQYKKLERIIKKHWKFLLLESGLDLLFGPPPIVKENRLFYLFFCLVFTPVDDVQHVDIQNITIKSIKNILPRLQIKIKPYHL